MTETAQVLELQAEVATDHTNNNNNNANKEIPRYSADSLTYNEFFWKHMRTNWPAVLTNVSENWECRCSWTVEDKNTRKINFDYLRNKIGNQQVPVANCAKQYFDSHEKIEMPFYEFLDYWQTKINGDTNGNCNQDMENLLYLKDWHLAAKLPNYNFYNIPQHFASDWLNEFLINTNKDDYRFVYMGPQSTWTPFHADVFGSYSWSTNIFGCKKWILLPPCEEQKLCDNLGNLPFSIDEAVLEKHNVQYFILYQQENEAIFVPSGWYHQVWNIADTISINHNWFNACNVERIWLNLVKCMQLVKHEIEDCRQMDNFDEHCQTMLRASFGLNYLDFIEILEFIAPRRCNMQQNTSSTLLYNINQYDVLSIKNVLQQMLQDSVVNNSRKVLYQRCQKLLDLLHMGIG